MKASYFLIAVILFLAYWMGKLYEPFLSDIVISALLATATVNIQNYFYKHTKSRLKASVLSTTSITLLIFMPLVYFVSALAGFINELNIEETTRQISHAQSIVHSFLNEFPLAKGHLDTYIAGLNQADIAGKILDFGTTIGKFGAVFFKDLFLIIVFYFFCHYYGREILDFLGSITPLRKDDLDEIYLEISSVMGVVFYSIFAVAVLEGFLFGFIVSFFGYDGLFLGVLYGFSSLVPVVGGLIMWIPVAGYEAINGSVTNAIIILVYSVFVISIIADTFVKPVVIGYINKKIIKTPTGINELLIFFSIIAGLATFGFWGMILGPAITALFIALLRLYGNLANIEESTRRSTSSAPNL